MTAANDTPAFRTIKLSAVRDELVSSNDCFAFVSKYTAWSTNTAPTFLGTYDDETLSWREMVYGKKVANSDVAYIVARNDWANGTVYEEYSTDKVVQEGDFFVVTDERKVYKCVFNNLGANSTSKPTATSNATFTTADGYVWKYMYTVSAAGLSKFGSASLMPVEANSTISAAAVNGTIDAVRVVGSGNNWTAHDSGTVAEKVSNTVFRISSSAEPSNGFYDDSGFYVSAGPGAGYYSRITTYFSNSTGNYVVLGSAANSVAFGSSYSIAPFVRITGDGSGAVAYAVSNTAADTVQSVAVANVGSGYTWAEVALEASASSSNSDYEVEAVISPLRGHGYDAVTELGSTSLAVSVSVANTDGVPSNFSFRACGVLKAPKSYANASQTFLSSEFSQYRAADVTLGVGVTDPPSAGELLTGLSSGATATVITANSTYVRLGDVRGAFTAGEGAVSNVSSATLTITAINTPSLQPYSGSLLVGSFFDPVTRSNTSTERVRFVVSV